MKVSFVGKINGSIGVSQPFNIEVYAETLEEAREKLYENYEHIMFLKQED